MKTRRIIPDPVLMVLTILIVTGFQVYWLKDNYDREKRTLQIRANADFQEAVRHLQMVKLKLKDVAVDTLHYPGKLKIVVNKDTTVDAVRLNGEPQLEMVTMVNALRDKIADSLHNGGSERSDVVSRITDHSRDSLHHGLLHTTFQLLYSVDSLQDSLRTTDIATSYQKRINAEDIRVPFRIVRIDSAKGLNEPDFSDVTIGFAHPVTYHLDLGNSFGYLARRIALPVLFSVFLVGVTILSFVLLYRNLLKQRKLAVLKNEFIGNITHELKTPIATVGVAIEALRNFNAIRDPQRTKEYLDISANELQRLGLLVDKVLKLSLFENSEVELKKETFDLRDLLNEVLTMMKLQFEKNHAKLSVETIGEDFMIDADRLHITSVLYNLFDNALKYSPKDPAIDINMCVLDNDFIELKIADNGIGIAREYRQKIFEKFFRVPTGDRHNIKGYGLGLSYVSEIMRRHHGVITVDGDLGKGTTFTIRLPRKHTDGS